MLRIILAAGLGAIAAVATSCNNPGTPCDIDNDNLLSILDCRCACQRLWPSSPSCELAVDDDSDPSATCSAVDDAPLALGCRGAARAAAHTMMRYASTAAAAVPLARLTEAVRQRTAHAPAVAKRIGKAVRRVERGFTKPAHWEQLDARLRRWATAHPRGQVVHAGEPLVVVVDGFLDAGTSDGLASYYDEASAALQSARARNGRSRVWCFWKWNGCQTLGKDGRLIPGDTPRRPGQRCGPSSRKWLGALREEHGLRPRRGTLARSHDRVCVEDAEFDRRIVEGRLLNYSTSLIAPAKRLDAVGHELARRAGLPFKNINDVQLLNYERGSSYRVHKDCEAANSPNNDRIFSALIYLNDVDAEAAAPGAPAVWRGAGEGPSGGTGFPALNFSVVPKRGRLVVWRNVYYSSEELGGAARCHPGSAHLSLPVRGAGAEKHAVQLWYHEHPGGGVGTRMRRREETGLWHFAPAHDVAVADAVAVPGSEHMVQCDPSESCREYMTVGNQHELM